MYVVVVGAGEVGSYVARILVDEGHEVAVVDANEEVAERLDASLNALVVHGSGVDPTALKSAGIGQADLLLAVTAQDEVNLIACMTARKYGAEGLRVVARVRQSRHVAGGLALSAADLGLDALISPEQAIANRAVEILRYAGSGEMREIADGKLVLVGMDLTADSPLVNDTLAQLRADFPGDFVVVAAQGRDGVRIPTGTDRLKAEERAFVVTLPEHLTELAILSGRPWHKVERVLIVGCGNTGLALARRLESQGLRPTILEADKERAELVAGMLPRSLVLCGDGTDPELLQARIEESKIDAVAVLLRNPEASVLIGLFATSLGAWKVIARCDKQAYVHFAQQHGVDAAISPKQAMTDAILRYVRRGKVEMTLALGEHDAEIIGFRVPPSPADPDLVRKPVKELPLPGGALVAAVVRGGVALIPTGATIFQPGDEVFFACRLEALRRLENLLS